jgi:hypothetical protein
MYIYVVEIMHYLSNQFGKPNTNHDIETLIILREKNLNYKSSGVVPALGVPGVPPGFGRSVKPISTRGIDYAHLIYYYWHPRTFRPTDGPEEN